MRTEYQNSGVLMSTWFRVADGQLPFVSFRGTEQSKARSLETEKGTNPTQEVSTLMNSANGYYLPKVSPPNTITL